MLKRKQRNYMIFLKSKAQKQRIFYTDLGSKLKQ